MAPDVAPAAARPAPDRLAPTIVIGGGISGLTLATLLRGAGVPVTLLEAEPRFGGVISTRTDGEWLFEYGPNTVLANNPLIFRLIEESGLGAERLIPPPESGRRYVVKGGRLQLLPGSPPEFFKSPLFSLGAKLRLFREPFIPPRTDGDESVADFARRRLGRELLDYAVGPFVSGVYAGDPEKLSVRHAVKRIHVLEQKYGSLIKGAVALQRKSGGGVSAGPRGGLLSFRRGLAALPERLAERLGDDSKAGAAVRSIRRAAGGGFEVETLDAGGAVRRYAAPRLVTAIEADSTARLLLTLDGAAGLGAGTLAEIPYAPVAITGLGFRREQIAHPLDGFGFLVPRVERRRILGCLFVSTLFPGRAPDGCVGLTVFTGGATDPDTPALPDDQLLPIVTRELEELLGATGAPVHARTVRWPRAIPQMNLGHERFMAVAEKVELAFPGLHLLGNWRFGVSVGDCILNAGRMADRLLGTAGVPGP